VVFDDLRFFDFVARGSVGDAENDIMAAFWRWWWRRRRRCRHFARFQL